MLRKLPIGVVDFVWSPAKRCAADSCDSRLFDSPTVASEKNVEECGPGKEQLGSPKISSQGSAVILTI